MARFEFSALLADTTEPGEPLSFSSISGPIDAPNRAVAMAHARDRAAEFFAPDQRSREILAGRRFSVTLSPLAAVGQPWRERFTIGIDRPIRQDGIHQSDRPANSSTDQVEHETDWPTEEMGA